ncbi:hypothetical protein FU323_03910 [Lactobacillus delbrueckii subsp. bulgaricus]|nr:hypothetical protein FU323_03910 [Lactobacillus delbrueckii subsp. bulgaricus]
MLCGNYILSNRSEWTFYFLSSVQFDFTISIVDLMNCKISTIKLWMIRQDCLTRKAETMTN